MFLCPIASEGKKDQMSLTTAGRVRVSPPSLKVHSHDAATPMAFLHQWSQSVHTGATMVVATVQ